MFFFQTALHLYRTNYGPNKLKKRGSQNVFFFSKRQTCPRFKSEISDLFFVCFLVRLRVQFVRYISWIFPIFTVFRTNYSLNMLKNCGSQNRLFQTACGAPFASLAELRQSPNKCAPQTACGATMFKTQKYSYQYQNLLNKKSWRTKIQKLLY